MQPPFGYNSTSGQINSLPANHLSSRYAPSPFGGRGTGLPWIDQPLMSFIGPNMYPVPQPGRNSTYDAEWQRLKDLQQLKIQNNALANSLPWKKLGGVNENSPMFAMLGSFMNNPDGPAARMLSPFIGGNPMLSQMSAFANLRGITMAGQGSMHHASAGELSRFQDTLYGKFYNHRAVDPTMLRNSQESIMQSARSNGADARLLGRVKGLFGTGDMALTEKDASGNTTSYGSFKREVSTLHDIASQLGSAKLDTAEGKQKAKEQAEAFLGAITDPESRVKIQEAIGKSIASGKSSAFSDHMGLDKLDLVARQLEVHATLRSGERVPTGINFANTHGFTIEDLSSSFTSAAAQRMLGRKGLIGNAEAYFDKDNSKALDSARGLFGNKLTGRELNEAMSNFLGVSSVDLTDKTQTGRLDTMQRTVKAMARTANISIEHLLDIIETAKGVASNTPGLQNLGGLELGEMVTKLGPTVMAMNATLSNRSVRQMGGTAGMLSQMVMGQMKQAAEPGALFLAGLHTRFSGNSAAQAEIRNFAATKAIEWPGISKLITGLSNTHGVNPHELYSYASSNTAGQNIGMAESDVFRNAGGRAASQAFLKTLNASAGGGEKGLRAVRQFSTMLSSQSVDLDRYVNELGTTGLDRSSPGGMALASQIKAGWSANSAGLSAAGLHSYEDLLHASPEVRQRFGGLHDAVAKLKMHLKDRVASHIDINGNVISESAVQKAGRRGAITEDFLTTDQVDFQSIQAMGQILGMPANALTEDIFKSGAVNSLRRGDSNYQAMVRMASGFQKQEVALDEFTSEKLGFLNAPQVTQMFNSVLNGDVGRGGLSEALKTIGYGPEAAQYHSILNASGQIADIRSADGVDSLMDAAKAGGRNIGDLTGRDLRSLLDGGQGLTGSQLSELGAETDLAGAKARLIKFLPGRADLHNDSATASLWQQGKNASTLGLGGINHKLTIENIREKFARDKYTGLSKEFSAQAIANIDKAYAETLANTANGKSGLPASQVAIARDLIAAGMTSTSSIANLPDGFDTDKYADGSEIKDATGNKSYHVKDAGGSLAAYLKRRRMTGSLSQGEMDKVVGELEGLGFTRQFADKASSVGKTAEDTVNKNLNDKLGSIQEVIANIPKQLLSIAEAVMDLGVK